VIVCVFVCVCVCVCVFNIYLVYNLPKLREDCNFKRYEVMTPEISVGGLIIQILQVIVSSPFSQSGDV
jgi:hypothetical protein